MKRDDLKLNTLDCIGVDFTQGDDDEIPCKLIVIDAKRSFIPVRLDAAFVNKRIDIQASMAVLYLRDGDVPDEVGPVTELGGRLHFFPVQLSTEQNPGGDISKYLLPPGRYYYTIYDLYFAESPIGADLAFYLTIYESMSEN